MAPSFFSVRYINFANSKSQKEKVRLSKLQESKGLRRNGISVGGAGRRESFLKLWQTSLIRVTLKRVSCKSCLPFG